MIGYIIKIPAVDNKFVSEISTALKLNSKPVVLNIVSGEGDEARGCFFNVQRRVESQGGEILFGWQLWEHPYMIEAEFHAVWRSPDETLIDITPKDDRSIKQILFVQDNERSFNGTQIDNFRLNTTGNRVIDDLIEVEKAKYRFMNKDGRDKIIGRVNLVGDDARLWQALAGLSGKLEYLHMSGGNINSRCFMCNSGVPYKDCHRVVVQKGMLEI